MCDKSILTQLELWTLMWLVMIISSLVAVNETIASCSEYVVDTWGHQPDECDEDGAILLSRAFTTLGWARGFAIGYGLLSILLVIWAPSGERGIHVSCSIKAPLCVALLIFSAAFDVNMFESSAHHVLISLGSVLGMVFTFPGVSKETAKGIWNVCYREDRGLKVCGCRWFSLRTTWWGLWAFAVVNCVLFMGFWSTSCANDNVPNDLCPVLRSDWYWTEYLFFWTMYLLVGYAVIVEELEETGEEKKLLEKRGPRYNSINIGDEVFF